MRVLNEYPGSHHYWDEFEKTKYHCPDCGKQEVWEEQGKGDFYVGVDYLCAACGVTFNLLGVGAVREANELGRLKQIREGRTAEPTTRLGG